MESTVQDKSAQSHSQKQTDPERYGTTTVLSSDNAFKPVFKAFKAKRPCDETWQSLRTSHVVRKASEHPLDPTAHGVDARTLEQLGLSTSPWRVYHPPELPGLAIVSNPFLAGAERFWVASCVKTYLGDMCRTSLDPHLCDQVNVIRDHLLWQQCVDEYAATSKGASDCDHAGSDGRAAKPVKQVETRPSLKQSHIAAQPQDETHRLHAAAIKYKLLPSGAAASPLDLLNRLRWLTLGMHYNWTTKKYHSADASPFPKCLAKLVTTVSAAVKANLTAAEAAIINFYPMGTTLGVHTDHSEEDQQASLVSISLGRSCVLLVGGSTLATKPHPLLLQSGDVVVMSGASRQAYHAVPTILSDDDERFLDIEGLPARFDAPLQESDQLRPSPQSTLSLEWSAEEDRLLSDFLQRTRINMNVRQVYPDRNLKGAADV